MTLQLSKLFGILANPSGTLPEIKKKAEFADVIKVSAIFAVAMFLIMLVSSLVAGMSALTILGVILFVVFMFVLGVILYLALSWMSTKLVGSFVQKEGNLDKTAGLIAHCALAFSLFVGVPLVLLILLMTLTPPLAALLVIPIGLLVFIWQLLIFGRAVAVANDTGWGTGIAAFFIAYIIMSVIIYIVSLVVGFII
jgi:hypothetical protein